MEYMEFTVGCGFEGDAEFLQFSLEGCHAVGFLDAK